MHEFCADAEVPTTERTMLHMIKSAAMRERLILGSGIRKKDT